MSEKKYTEVETIPLSAIINIELSGEFLARLNQFIVGFFPFKSKEHFQEIMKDIKDNTNQDDLYVYHMKTLLALQATIEQGARNQKLTVMLKIDENGQPIQEETPQSDQSLKQH